MAGQLWPWAMEAVSPLRHPGERTELGVSAPQHPCELHRAAGGRDGGSEGTAPRHVLASGDTEKDMPGGTPTRQGRSWLKFLWHSKSGKVRECLTLCPVTEDKTLSSENLQPGKSENHRGVPQAAGASGRRRLHPPGASNEGSVAHLFPKLGAF